MKYKIINPSPVSSESENEQAKTESEKVAEVLAYYQNYLKKNRAVWVKAEWEKIKKDPITTFYTVDTIFLIWKEILRTDLDEFRELLKLVQENSSLRSAFVKILEAEDLTSFMSGWDVITSEDYLAFFKGTAATSLSAILENNRSALNELQVSIHTNLFHEYFRYSRRLFEELNNKLIKNFLNTTPVAVQLLENERIREKISPELESLDLMNMLSLEVPDKKKFTVGLLDRCVNDNIGALAAFLVDLNKQLPTPEIKKVRANVLAASEKLLDLLKNETIFFSYVDSIANLMELLFVFRDPVSILIDLAKANETIAKWIGQRLILIVAALLKNSDRKRLSEVKRLIQYYDGGKLLSSLIRERLEKEERVEDPTLYATEMNALFTVLSFQEIRDVVKLTKEPLKALLAKSELYGLFDRLVTEDEQLWKIYIEFINKDVERIADYQFKFPLITARVIVNTIRLFSIEKLYSTSLTALQAFILTNSIQWETVRNSFQVANIGQGLRLHPIIKLRLEFDRVQTEYISFREYFFKHISHPENLFHPQTSSIRTKQDWQIVASLGSDDELKKSLEMLIERRKAVVTSQPSTAQVNKTIDGFLRTVVGNFYSRTKLIAAINVNNILNLIDIFYYPEMMPYFDGDMLLETLFMSASNKTEFREKLSIRKDLLLQLFVVEDAQEETVRLDNTKSRTSLLKNLLSDENLVNQLFVRFDDQDYLKLINVVSEKILKYIFESKSCEQLKLKLLDVIKRFFGTITNVVVLNYIFQKSDIVKAIAESMTFDQFFALITSGMTNEPWMKSLLGHLHHFKLDLLLKDKAKLLLVLCKNRILGKRLLQQWPIYNASFVLPEELFHCLYHAEGKPLDWYLKGDAEGVSQKDNNYFLSMVRNIIPNLKEKEEILQEYPMLRLPHRDHREPPLEVNLEDKDSLLEPVIPVKRQSNRFGFDLPEKRILQPHFQRILTAREIGVLFFLTLESQPILIKANLFPLTIILEEKFYGWLGKTNQRVFSYLTSLPRNFLDILKTKLLIALPSTPDKNNLRQVLLLKILNAWRVLLMNYLCATSNALASDPDNGVLRNNFLQMLYLGCENFPNDVIGFLRREDVPKLCLQSLHMQIANHETCQYEGEILARLLVLWQMIKEPVNLQEERLSKLVRELNCQPNSLLKRQFSLILRIFPAEYLLSIKDKQLTAYFLRMPRYRENLSRNQTLQLLESDVELKHLESTMPEFKEPVSKTQIPLSTTAELVRRLDIVTVNDTNLPTTSETEALTRAILQNERLSFLKSHACQTLMMQIQQTLNIDPFDTIMVLLELFTIVPDAMLSKRILEIEEAIRPQVQLNEVEIKVWRGANLEELNQAISGIMNLELRNKVAEQIEEEEPEEMGITYAP